MQLLTTKANKKYSYKNKLFKYKEELISLIYPKFCFNCNKNLSPQSDIYVCLDCQKDFFQNIMPPFCNYCGKPLGIYLLGNSNIVQDNVLSDERCSECIGNEYYFSRGYTASLYDGLVKYCIRKYKYDQCTYLVDTLLRLMLDFSSKYINTNNLDFIIPVPIHWYKCHLRGFDQVKIIAKKLSKKLCIPLVSNVLKRTKFRESQMSLPKDKRTANVLNAFQINNKSTIFGKNILLIDDIYTTGATFNECSKLLIKAGAKKVEVFSLARGL